MVMIEALPKYQQAAQIARANGTTITALLEAYLDGYIAAHNSEDGEYTTFHSSEEAVTYLRNIVNGVRNA